MTASTGAGPRTEAPDGASPPSNADNTQAQSPWPGVTLAALPKSWTFTSSLPPDPMYPTPAESHRTPRHEIHPRQVRHALFTWVRPEPQSTSELLAVSPAAMRDLGLLASEAETEDFKQTVVGNKLWGWDEEKETGEGYPWAQCYGGWQFGSWAGQLGDGRAISLFEATNPFTGARYEVQLKGAGITPYSRFADGKAVLRSSIREFIVSEYLHAIGVPTTRALAISLLPNERVRRERIEPGAIVVRFAPSWLRIGTFDLPRMRGDRELVRQLATYLAEHVIPGGWEALPARLEDPSSPPQDESILTPLTGIPPSEIQGSPGEEENRFARLFRHIARLNALMVASLQSYAFTNGVLNTDNTSLLGLSMDYGPFAFLDVFDPSYTPNHDDDTLRYSYRNQPTIIWWNLVRLAEALGELLAAGGEVDEEWFVSKGFSKFESEEATQPYVRRAEKIIAQAGQEYKAVFLAEYTRLMRRRLGFRTVNPDDLEGFISPLLDTMESLSLDYNLFFRTLSSIPLVPTPTPELWDTVLPKFFYPSTPPSSLPQDKAPLLKDLTTWLEKWHERIKQDWNNGNPLIPEIDQERIKAMKGVNPKFVPRGWIFDEVIRRVEKDGERNVLKRLLHLSLHPFEDNWAGREFDGVLYEGNKDEEERWTSDVPKVGRMLQCSCSS